MLLTVSDLIGREMPEEVLIGRGFLHYVNGLPVSYPETEKLLSDFSFDLQEDQLSNDKKFTELFINAVGADVWVKRFQTFTHEQRPELSAILAITLNNGVIYNSQFLNEYNYSAGGSFFTMPGMESDIVNRRYEEDYFYYEEIPNEVNMLYKQRYIPKGFSFIGKKMPKNYDVDYIQVVSGSRFVESNFYVRYNDDTEIIERFEYQTHNSNMRPESVEDRYDEAVADLVVLLDYYTDEEYDELIKEFRNSKS